MFRERGRRIRNLGNVVPRRLYLQVLAERDYLSKRIQIMEYACDKAREKIEELHTIIKDLQEKNKLLEEENISLRKAVERLQNKLCSKKQQSFTKKSPKQSNARVHNNAEQLQYIQLLLFEPKHFVSTSHKVPSHRGITRKTPKTIDKVVDVYPQKCSECGSINISLCDRKTEHFEEDIIINITTTKYIHHYAYCKDCKKVTCAISENEQADSYIGSNARALAVTMYLSGIPINKISEIFEDAFEMKLSPASICAWVEKAAQNVKPVYDKIGSIIKTSKVTYVDETSWYIKGKQHWAWCFTSPPMTYYHIDKSRGSKVLREFFGDYYNGILISDFFSAYNLLNAKAKGKCFAHLLRHINDIDGVLTKEEEKRVAQIKELLQEGFQMYCFYKEGNIPFETLQESRKLIEIQLGMLVTEKFYNTSAENVRKLIVKHFDEIFTFIKFADVVEPTNNVCERKLRPLVITRKNSYGNKVLSAAQNLFQLKSVVETARSNGTSPFEIISILFKGRSTHNIEHRVFGNCKAYKQLEFPFISPENATGPPL